MRKHRTIVVFAAFALILAVIGMMSFNCVQKLSQGYPLSHNTKVKTHACLRDTVASPAENGIVALPASAVVLPEPSPAFRAEGIKSPRNTTNPFMETLPLRC